MALLDILEKESDEDHPLELTDLVTLLNEKGIKAERKAVYRSLDAIRATGRLIHQVRGKGTVGYYMDHSLNMAEALILCEILEDNVSLSREETIQVQEKLKASLSRKEQESLQVITPPMGKNPQSGVLETTQKLMKAIHENRCVQFRYYDLNIHQKKNYRRQKKTYHLLPVAVAADHGRLYCVLWSDKHQGFANYRIDRMEFLSTDEEIHDPVVFDKDAWMRSSFSMYPGDPVTAVITFDLSLAPAVYDQFGSDVIITSSDEKTFTAAIRTAITPTLIAWLMQFIDKVKVEKPQELIDTLLSIAAGLQKTYNGEKEGRI